MADERDDELLGLLDESRADEVAGERARTRSLRRQAEADATVAGTLLDLVEARIPVTVRTESGRTHHGVLAGLGDDVAVLEVRTGTVLVRLSGLAVIRPHDRVPPASGDRPAGGARLVELLADAAGDRRRVSIVCRGAGEPVSGELLAAGADVLTVRLDGDRRVPCYVRADAVVEVLIDRA